MEPAEDGRGGLKTWEGGGERKRGRNSDWGLKNGRGGGRVIREGNGREVIEKCENY